MHIELLPRYPEIGQVVEFTNTHDEGMMLTQNTRGMAGQMIYLSPQESIGLSWDGLKWNKLYNDFESEEDEYLYRLGL